MSGCREKSALLVAARAGRRYKALDTALSLLHLLAQQNKDVHKWTRTISVLLGHLW